MYQNTKKTKTNHFVYYFIKVVVGFFFKLIYRPKVVGSENIPNNVPIILAGNHKHNFDCALLISTNKRVLHFLGKKELFDGKLKGFFKAMQVIPVDRSNKNPEAKQEAINILKNNEIIAIFPEGTINRTKEIIVPFKYGAVSLSEKADAFIVPFAITGKYQAFSNKVKIQYGQPYKITNDLTIENELLMSKVTTLIEEGTNEKK